MKKSIMILLVFIFSNVIFSSEQDILGYWITEKSESGNQIVLEIYKTDNNKYNGVIKKLTNPIHTTGEYKGKEIMDIYNTNEKLKTRKLVGIDFVYNFTYNPKNNRYENGNIYNPTDGKTYYCYMYIKENGDLYVRGSIDKSGFFGKTQTWKKYNK